MADLQEGELFLQLPDEFLVAMLQHLPVVHVLKCKQVCQRFRRLLESQKFWKTYLQTNYNFELVDKCKEGRELTQYNLDALVSDWYCFWDESNEIPPENDQTRFVFRPLPQMWTNGIITPDKFTPFPEEDRDYYAFHKAVYLLLKLREKCKVLHVTSTPYHSTMDSVVDFCLFPWELEELPQPKEVLQVFNAHAELVRLRSESEEAVHVGEKLEYRLEEDFEDERDYERYITSLNNTFTCNSEDEGSQEEFYKWVQGVFQPSLMFCAGIDAIHPQLYFHLTFLSLGWVGGAFTTISIV